MWKTLTISAVIATGLVAHAAAHHGWGSYDASKPVTVAGKITTSSFDNPHATITVQAPEKLWTVVLAPPSRMVSRGAPSDLIATGKTISAVGYASTAQKEELRAERITVDGNTIEMR